MSFYIKIQSIGCLFVDKYFRLHRHHADKPPTVDRYPIDPILADTSVLKIWVTDLTESQPILSKTWYGIGWYVGWYSTDGRLTVDRGSTKCQSTYWLILSADTTYCIVHMIRKLKVSYACVVLSILTKAWKWNSKKWNSFSFTWLRVHHSSPFSGLCL